MELIYNRPRSNAERNRNKKKTEDRLKKDCLYETNIYDQMLADSLLICEMLQTHLTDCIDGVRAHSPTVLSSPFTSPPTSPLLSRTYSSQPLYYQYFCSSQSSPILTPKIQNEVLKQKDNQDLSLKFSNLLPSPKIEPNSLTPRKISVNKKIINRFQQPSYAKDYMNDNYINLKKQNNDTKKTNPMAVSQKNVANLPPIPITESKFKLYKVSIKDYHQY